MEWDGFSNNHKCIYLFTAIIPVSDHNNFCCEVEIKLASLTGWNETLSKLRLK